MTISPLFHPGLTQASITSPLSHPSLTQASITSPLFHPDLTQASITSPLSHPGLTFLSYQPHPSIHPTFQHPSITLHTPPSLTNVQPSPCHPVLISPSRFSHPTLTSFIPLYYLLSPHAEFPSSSPQLISTLFLSHLQLRIPSLFHPSPPLPSPPLLISPPLPSSQYCLPIWTQ
ncbi:hypothetical protein Pmani_033392 [Petrolisthes manimaculis]|uniref:Uncharacterized protein n=1 Tax=Petrolisthes manimaculis TaxID=1843537 RepID=A0AAE1NRD5_9EUCA|nr:hypothetical protein Pmani_033392 [Petrolisthes manimaculis]